MTLETENWYSPTGNALNFVKMPRFAGYPHQVRVSKKGNMWRLFRQWEELGYCIFVSIYPIVPGKEVLVDKIFIDFDDAEKPEHSLTDIRKVIRWALQKGYQPIPIYTGRAGYHLYILLQPKVYSIKKVQDTSLLKQKLRVALNWIAAQGWLWRYDKDGDLDKEYGKTVRHLRTVDERIRGDYKRIARVPGYRYVKYKKGTYFPRDTFCSILPIDMVLNASHAKIVEYCKERRYHKPTLDPDARLVDLDEFLLENKISIEHWLCMGTINPIQANFTEYSGQYTDANADIIKKLFPKMCMHNDVLGSEEPRHITRFYAAIMLIFHYHKHPEWVVEFFRNRNWTDFSEEETRTQVYQIANHIPQYIPPSCSTIKTWGLCVKDKCPQYRTTLEG